MNLEAIEYAKMTARPLYYIRTAWGLVPQPIKEEYRTRYTIGLYTRGKAWDTFCASVQPFWFEEFRDGLHITWQQTLVLYGIEKALRGEVPVRISVVSGHGIGKSAMLSWLILWFLFVHPASQVACTSPGKEQMYDVLWKELAKWIERMPQAMAAMYQWESTHIRMKESPETWFARAKTASKENTEALAGVHADWVLMAVDEASGVEETIYETMEGALTSGNVLVFLISNGTRSIGYFYDSHHKDAEQWQNYSFDSEASPRVDRKFVDAIEKKYGRDSVTFRIRVSGKFPDEGIMDDKGFVQLFNESDLHLVPFDPEWRPVGRIKGALDPSGEGQDESDWAVRDRMRAAIVASEKTSTPASMAQISLTVCDKFNVQPIDFTIDAFGKGHPVAQEIALATVNMKEGAWRVTPVNTGDPCDDEDDQKLYVNKRAMIFYRMMLWCRAGGEIMLTEKIRDQLLSLRFKRTLTGRIQIMDKVTMKKLGFPSPDEADAISMTFLEPDSTRPSETPTQILERKERTANDFDPHTAVE